LPSLCERFAPSFSRVREHDCPLWIPLSIRRYLHFILVLILPVVIVKHPMLWILFYGFNVSTCLQISLSSSVSLRCRSSLTVLPPLSVTLFLSLKLLFEIIESFLFFWNSKLLNHIVWICWWVLIRFDGKKIRSLVCCWIVLVILLVSIVGWCWWFCLVLIWF
jgi:hypothetical protein